MEKKNKTQRAQAAQLVHEAGLKLTGALLLQLSQGLVWLVESGFTTHGDDRYFSSGQPIGYIRRDSLLLFNDIWLESGKQVRVGAYGELKDTGVKRYVWRATISFTDRDMEAFRRQLQESLGMEPQDEKDASTAVYKAVRLAKAVEDLFNADRKKTDKVKKVIAGYLKSRMASDFSTATGEDCEVRSLPLTVAQCEEE